MHATIKAALAAAAIGVGIAGAASAATFDGTLEVEGGGGGPIGFELGGGEYLGLVGLRGAEAGDVVDLASINALVRSNAFTAIYVAPEGVDNFDGVSEFEDISGGASVGGVFDRSGGRIFNAIFGRFSDDDGAGTGFVVQTSSGTSSFGFGNANLAATNPLETAAPVPVPAALPLLAVALGGLGFAARRKSG